MKNLILILSVFILSSCSDKKIIQEKDQLILKLQAEIDSLKNPQLLFNGEQLNEYSPNPGLTVNPSGKIDSMTASRKLLSYKVWKDIADNGSRDASINWQAQIYGFYFTWPELRDYISEVKTLNSGLPSDKKIDGLRIYLGANFDPLTMSFIPDAFLMPTQGYKNYIDIDPDYPNLTKGLTDNEIVQILISDEQSLNDGPVFNKSLPCPQTCP